MSYRQNVPPAAPVKDVKENIFEVLTINKPPESDDKEGYFDYVCCIHPDAPFHTWQVSKWDLHKYVYHSDCSLVKNISRPKIPQIPRKMLSEKEAEFIVSEAKRHKITIPRRLGAPVRIKLSDWLIVKKFDEFDEKTDYRNDRSEEAAKIRGEKQKIVDEYTFQQRVQEEVAKSIEMMSDSQQELSEKLIATQVEKKLKELGIKKVK